MICFFSINLNFFNKLLKLAKNGGKCNILIYMYAINSYFKKYMENTVSTLLVNKVLVSNICRGLFKH